MQDTCAKSISSRFSLQKLKSLDREKKLEYSKILYESKAMDSTQFLKTYNPLTAPFLYEMRIHIFRRDRYFARAQGSPDNDSQLRQYFTTAYKENLILQRYFGETLKHTAYWWDQSKVDVLLKHIDPDTLYESPVCRDLFTSFTERQLWVVIFGVLFVFVFMNIKFYSREAMLCE